MEGRLTAPPRKGMWALAALATILVSTAAWWTLALWPLPSESPEWLLRTRAACFGTRADGLPDAGGWVLLLGEPIGMLAALLIVWGDAVRAGLATLARTGAGRAALGVGGVALAAGVTGAGARVRFAESVRADRSVPERPADLPRLNRVAPPLRLLDQRGDWVSLEQFRGRPVLLAFAYGHCQTACPVVVHEMLEARNRAAAAAPAVLVVTLDPWRDTPERLPYLAEAWGLSGEAHVLGGTTRAVEQTLDAWRVARSRDPRTGEIIHPARVYVIDREGRIAFLAPGGAAAIADLVRRL